MKMKEVTEKTKLTDRAIRLYIENGLVSPDIDESYSGRKSIDFSERDIERLKNIALLRKADFSIADIKLLFDDNTENKDIISQYISDNEKDIQNKSRIITKLEDISEKDSLSVEDICNALFCELAETNVPKEDLNLTAEEIKNKKFEKIFAIFNMSFSAFVLIAILIIYKAEFRFTQPVSGGEKIFLFFYFGWIINIILSSVILFLNNRYSISLKRIKDLIALFIVTIGILSFISTLFSPIIPPVYSVTSDPDNYLKLDRWVEKNYGDEIKNFFPEFIPPSALISKDEIYEEKYPFSTRYFYRHTYCIDACFDIIAEWSLPENEYTETKKKVLKEAKSYEKKGEWICTYFTKENNFGDRCILIFAYNDSLKKIRYIASYDPQREYYYLNLDW